MIISRTPVRVSICGGGTDVDGFALVEPSGGRVTSIALDRYVYVTLNPRFDDSIRVSYSSMELVDTLEDVQHDLVREAMRLTGVTSGVEITTIADIPGRGTGLGSSSSVTVGLLNALHTFAGIQASKDQLAEEACQIEIDVLGAPIGRQDQYAAAFGGVNSIRFGPEGVLVEPVVLNDQTIDAIRDELTLVYTGLTRSASLVLAEASDDPSDKLSRLRAIRMQADEAREMLESGELTDLGLLLNETWLNKRGISTSVSNVEIDTLYDRIMNLGASGAKLLGAGAGGFLLVHGDASLRETLIRELGSANVLLPLGIDFDGSTIIHGTGHR
jgi:D-glycero-alpha-D-manno-heptose-7-phosphate kinase